MKIWTHNLATRVGATALGIGFVAVGMFSLSAVTRAPTDGLADRAFWLGSTFLIAGALSIAVSWLVADLHNIWCVPPRKSRKSARLTIQAGQNTGKTNNQKTGRSRS